MPNFNEIKELSFPWFVYVKKIRKYIKKNTKLSLTLLSLTYIPHLKKSQANCFV